MKINTMRRQWWPVSNRVTLSILDRKHEIKQRERVRERNLPLSWDPKQSEASRLMYGGKIQEDVTKRTA